MADNKNTGGDEYVAMFQKWYNKTYGMPTIAVDGLMSNGTKEAYSTHGNDFIKEIDKEFQKEKTDLSNKLTDSMKKVSDLQQNSMTKNKSYVFIGGALVFGLVLGIIIKNK